ncbi:MAG: DUF2400 family protein [Thermofilaceae archaeon]
MGGNVYVLNDLECRYLTHVLDDAYNRLKDDYLESSALGPARLYSARDSTDKEFWALFCALIDFQIPVVSILNPMLKGLLSYMEEHGIKFIDLLDEEDLARNVFTNFQWKSSTGVKRGFRHRFVKIEDLIELLTIFKRVIGDYGSLRTIVEDAYKCSLHLEEPMEAVLHTLVGVFRKYGGRPPLTPVRFSSPLKRLNLFMRWMVRPYPDLGLWDFISKRHLLVSLDEGLRRVLSRAFCVKVGMSWDGVVGATRFLRRINPGDPVKYDYLLSRVSIKGYCAKDLSRTRCYLCPLINVCRSSNFTPKPKTSSLKGKEREIFERFLSRYGHEYDSIHSEFPLGNYTADALLHKLNCETQIVEVEEQLNYNAIGQVLIYRYLYFKIYGKAAKPIVICTRSRRELKEACEREQGITVIEVGYIR